MFLGRAKDTRTCTSFHAATLHPVPRGTVSDIFMVDLDLNGIVKRTKAGKLTKKNEVHVYLPMELNGTIVLVKVNDNQWRVDNSSLASGSKGLGYRTSKVLEAKSCDNISARYAEWGTIASGIDTGDGWLQVLLPTKFPLYSRGWTGSPIFDIVPISGSILCRWRPREDPESGKLEQRWFTRQR
ncbi:unnamed protein product [Prorocentrum cordatum]|uniref:Uncharacterized protein n=1 Tax=Prorocentrum cordatum TaxID=2364126 RepID=A0ABN9W7Q4_9DINO|nr:unnamed protein product [Polarella glacialis]